MSLKDAIFKLMIALGAAFLVELLIALCEKEEENKQLEVKKNECKRLDSRQ